MFLIYLTFLFVRNFHMLSKLLSFFIAVFTFFGANSCGHSFFKPDESAQSGSQNGSQRNSLNLNSHVAGHEMSEVELRELAKVLEKAIKEKQKELDSNMVSGTDATLNGTDRDSARAVENWTRLYSKLISSKKQN